MRIEITVCDVCESTTEQTKQYQLATDNSTRTLDLCSEHAQPLHSVLQATTKANTPPAKKTAQTATQKPIQVRKKPGPKPGTKRKTKTTNTNTPATFSNPEPKAKAARRKLAITNIEDIQKQTTA